MLSLKTYRDRAKGLPDLLNWAAMVADGVMLGKDGSFTAGWRFAGSDVDTATNGERNAIAQRLNQALSSLGSGYMVHVDTLRSVTRAYPDASASFFTHPIMQMMDDSRRALFESQGDKFATHSMLFVTWRPSAKRLSKVTDLLFEQEGKTEVSMASRNLSRFQDKMNDLQGRLSSVFPVLVRLGAQRRGGQAFDALQEALRGGLVGGDTPVSVAATLCRWTRFWVAWSARQVLPLAWGSATPV
ncbi:conjugative transfer protein TrbE [Vibrio astriarenae]|nr:conjugative transfer protein TrbE [Vibrio sp. C7]